MITLGIDKLGMCICCFS